MTDWNQELRSIEADQVNSDEYDHLDRWDDPIRFVDLHPKPLTAWELAGLFATAALCWLGLILGAIGIVAGAYCLIRLM